MNTRPSGRGSHGIRLALLASIIASLAAFSPTLRAAPDAPWIGTWTASPQPVWGADFPVAPGLPRNYWKQTIRQVARVSIGGSRVRIVLSNEYGTRPLTIGDAHIAVAESGGRIRPGSDRALTFGGRASISIPPGAPAMSDPVDLAVAPLSQLAVSLFFPDLAEATTMHWDGHQTAYVTAGNRVSAVEFKADATQTQRVFLSEILVDAADGARAIVAFGDSITDGDGSTVDGNDRWPDLLAARLVAAGGPPVAVLDQGISGAKVLSHRMGTNALARFDRDVLNQPRVDTVIVMMGINDIGWPASGLAPNDRSVTADDLIAGYRQLIARARARGVRIIGATLTPFGDAFAGGSYEGYFTPEKEQVRLAVNAFIRSGAFDGVIDFDKVVVDPARPGCIQPRFDKGDHLHPNPAGYKAMADSIDLALLRR